MNCVFCVKRSPWFLLRSLVLFLSLSRSERPRTALTQISGTCRFYIQTTVDRGPPCEPAGIRTIIWFLILAAFSSHLQVVTTVGKIELQLPGGWNMHVCLILNYRGKRWHCSTELLFYQLSFLVGRQLSFTWVLLTF